MNTNLINKDLRFLIVFLLILVSLVSNGLLFSFTTIFNVKDSNYGALGFKPRSPEKFQTTSLQSNLTHSVVQVTAYSPINSTQMKSMGSGFVYDRLGHIITSNHLVNRSKTVNVEFVDGNRYVAKVIGNDPISDLAVLQITDNFSEEKGLPLIIGNSSEVRTSEHIIAVGNPFGTNSTIIGNITQIGPLQLNPNTVFFVPNVIQTNIPNKQSYSGGPLLNTQGHVIGMNTAISSYTDTFSGTAVAVPSNIIKRIVPSLIVTGNYTHPYIGLSGDTLTSDFLAKTTNYLPASFKGIYVDKIAKDGPADKANIRGATTDQYGRIHGGDIISAIDSHNVTKINDLLSYIEEHKSVGDNIIFTIFRNGHYFNLNASLAARPSLIPFIPYNLH